MSSMRSIVLLALVLVAAAIAGGGEEPQKPDAFLLDWVRENARFDIAAGFHEKCPGSPHKRASEEYEVAVKCFFLRQSCGEERAGTLAVELLALYRAEITPEETRRRILHVLGRLRSPEAVPWLVEAARRGTGELRDTGIGSLAFFGSVPAEESFSIFGGRIRSVVFPAAPEKAATEVLLGLLGEMREAKVDSAPGTRAVDQLRRCEELTRLVVRALRAHRSRAVADATLDALLGSPRLCRWQGEELEKLLGSNHDHVAPERIEALLVDEPPAARRVAAALLGWSADAKAVAPLLRLLADEDLAVRAAANDALCRLSGDRRSTVEEWTTLLGPQGEKLDPTKSARPEEPKPGIYRWGR